MTETHYRPAAAGAVLELALGGADGVQALLDSIEAVVRHLPPDVESGDRDVEARRASVLSRQGLWVEVEIRGAPTRTRLLWLRVARRQDLNAVDWVVINAADSRPARRPRSHTRARLRVLLATAAVRAIGERYQTVSIRPRDAIASVVYAAGRQVGDHGHFTVRHRRVPLVLAMRAREGMDPDLRRIPRPTITKEWK